ncbi:MAG: TonB family protein [Thermoanaerobaculia bacterium]
MERSAGPPSSNSQDPADLAWRDDLTGAWNRRYLRQLLTEEWPAVAARSGTVTLLVVDLDAFKAINDSLGHLAGDDVLQRASNQLRASFRAEDQLIRYGGDEFVVVLRGASEAEARALAERARAALHTVEVVDRKSGESVTLPLSFSMGIASFPADGAIGEEVLAVADRRLYEEKRIRQAAATRAMPADRGRRRLLALAAIVCLVLGTTVVIEWRRIRRAPAPPAEVLALPGADASAVDSPATEIVIRDEEELARLRDEVRRLEAALAVSRPAAERARDEGRIRELEARLAEAGDPGTGDGGDAGSATRAAGAGSAGTGVEAVDPLTGMKVGERRLREDLQIADPPPAGSDGQESAEAAAAAAGAADASNRPPAPGAAAGAQPGAAAFTPPQLVRALRPAYPRMARERRRSAIVELRVRVSATGKVLSVETVGEPAGFGFDDSAREAAMSAQFRPGRREGVPVEMETRLSIRFVLESR